MSSNFEFTVHFENGESESTNNYTNYPHSRAEELWEIYACDSRNVVRISFKPIK